MPARSSRPNSPIRRIPPPTSVKPPIPVDLDDLQPSDDELAHSTLAEGLKRLAVEPMDARFLGKSSGAMLVQAAMNMKRELDGAPEAKSAYDLLPSSRRQQLWAPLPVSIIRELAAIVFPTNSLASVGGGFGRKGRQSPVPTR